MGSYFPLSNNQRDPATMLYLKDPTSTSHSSTPIGNTIMYMNFPSSSEAYSNAIAGNSHSHTACMDVPPVTSASNSSSQEFLMNFGGSRALENQLNTWKDGRNEMLMMHQAENSCVLQGTPNLQGQGLSLSLSTHVPLHVSSIPYNESGDYSSILGSNPLLHGEDRGRNISFENEDSFQNGVNADGGASDISSYGMQSISRTVPNSKYLRAAQELLDEVVNVKKAIKEQHARKELRKDWKEGEFKDGSSDPSAAASSSATSNANGPSQIEFSPSEKQELQNKLTKLLSMLDEVDRKYRQYYHQMQIVVTSFDVIAGSGAAKPYTALALQTISRHFRCLRDAINAQIQVARSNLGEEDGAANDRGVGISRLRYVDQQLRQQRALQQLGMMQQHAWRPQRGLPETSVSVLRAWLFEHFLHPYPKDSEKIMLARQAGLTRSQVSNWFINARVRLWKPMVEEMYKEETGDADMDSNTSSETNQRSVKPSQDKAEEHAMEPKSDEINDVEMGSDVNSIFQSEYGVGEAREGRKILPESSRFQDQIVDTSYHIAELERFGSVGGVSLTLGLQSEGGRMGMHDGSHNPFMPLRESDLYNSTSSAMGSENAGFECMDSGNRQHQLVSSLLPSFT